VTTEPRIAAVNGTRLVYDEAGEGPPVVLVHGFTLDRRMWDDQMTAFAAHHRVVRYDLRGFGASAPPVAGAPYTHADDLQALLEHLGIERAAIVGLSLGGWVAHEFALTYPESLSALVLVDSALRGYSWGPETAATIDAIYALGADGRLDEAKAGWLADPLFACAGRAPEASARIAEMIADYSCWHLLQHDPHPPLVPPANERLHEIGAPTLIVVGEEDLPDFHAIADRLAGEIPDARKTVLPAAGHMANMDAPEAFNRVVLDFLAAESARKPAAALLAD
jgi:pimeloyl-ACP methyl ester carboxylesterase